MKLKRTDSWTHISHLRRASKQDWSIERTADLKLHPNQDKKKMRAMRAADPRIQTRPVRPTLLIQLNELFTKFLSPYQNVKLLYLVQFSRWVMSDCLWPHVFSMSPSYEYSRLIPLGSIGLISLQSKGLKSLLKYPSSKASILRCSAIFMVQFSHTYMTTGKNHSHSFE